MGLIDDTTQKGINAWMNFATSGIPGKLVTWAAMEANSVLAAMYMRGLVGRARLVSVVGVGTSEGATIRDSWLTDLTEQALIMPNFMGIVFYTTNETSERKVDVAESLTIVEDGYNKEYNIDNAVPRLKEWTFDCYIGTEPGCDVLDVGLTVKPTLEVQIGLLDNMAKSRMPGWLKTSMGVFYKAQITSLKFDHRPESLNYVHTIISFKEYKPLKLSTGTSLINVLPEVEDE